MYTTLLADLNDHGRDAIVKFGHELYVRLHHMQSKFCDNTINCQYQYGYFIVNIKANVPDVLSYHFFDINLSNMNFEFEKRANSVMIIGYINHEDERVMSMSLSAARARNYLTVNIARRIVVADAE